MLLSKDVPTAKGTRTGGWEADSTARHSFPVMGVPLLGVAFPTLGSGPPSLTVRKLSQVSCPETWFVLMRLEVAELPTSLSFFSWVSRR